MGNWHQRSTDNKWKRKEEDCVALVLTNKCGKGFVANVTTVKHFDSIDDAKEYLDELLLVLEDNRLNVIDQWYNRKFGIYDEWLPYEEDDTEDD